MSAKEIVTLFSESGKKGAEISAKKAGESRMKGLTPEEKSALGKTAAAARWGKKKASKTANKKE